MNPNTSLDAIPPELIEYINEGKCVLFLGADLPLGYPGAAPPCRAELAAALAGEPGRLVGEQNLAKVASLYEGARGRQALVRQVMDSLDQPAYRPATLHHQIAALPFRAIITTTQDRLLERALDEAGKRHSTVITDVETPYIEEDRVMLYKLHGCVSRPDTLVLTGKDHALLNRRLQAYLSVLRYLFVTRPLLFLAYNLDDPLFATIFHEVTASVEGQRRRAYASWPDAPAAWRDIWLREELKLFDLPAAAFLDALSRQVTRRERALADKILAGPLNKPPYKFLDYYETSDRDIFYGRQIEAVRFFRLCLTHPLTVLFGASGTGKTSLLKAGVMPLLHEQGYATAYVRALDDPLQAVRAEVLDLLRQRGRAVADPGAAGLHDFFAAVLDPEDRLVVFLDQFEEFFLRLGEPVKRRFWTEIAAFRERVQTIEGSPEVRFVFSLREDFLPPLDEARAFIPTLLGDSYRLVNMSDDKASTVITEPAARAGLILAPDLVQQMLDDLREEGVIAPPQLQIVCDRLYRDCLANPESVSQGGAPVLVRHEIGLDDYRRLREARGILADYVDYALAQLPDAGSREIAWELLKVMVTSQRTKAALTWAEILAALAEGDGLSAGDALAQEQARDVLTHLVRLRLVREFERGNVALYELAHDHVAHKISASISEEEMAVKAVRELLRREVEGWQRHGLLIAREALRLIHEQREALHRLSAAESELLFRSALAAGYEVSYWFGRAREAGVAVDAIAKEGLLSDIFRPRAAAVKALAELGDAFAEDIIRMLGDPYPQVRAAAIRALERLRPNGAWRVDLRYECYVPAGEFTMGDNQGDNGEKPAHPVTLDAFYIGKYPVTNADYACYQQDIGRPFGMPPGKETHPAVSVSWYDARDYALWAGMRLLTEAEWEKAASWEPAERRADKANLLQRVLGQAATTRAGGRKHKYPWGDEFDKEKCNTSESGKLDTTPVGAYSAKGGDSPYGIADMAGNVWEWTSSLKKEYPYDPNDGREDMNAAESRVLRGGSFFNHVRYARCASRPFGYNPDSRYGLYGFRVALSPGPLASENSDL